MKPFWAMSSSCLSFSGFLALFSGLLLFGFGLNVEAQSQGNPFCYTCPCAYPNSGWCDSNANACGNNNSGCGCSAFTGCNDYTAPTQPDPY